MSEYKPGTVAMAIRADGPEFLVVRTRGGEAGDYWSAPQGWPAGVSLHDIQGYRPLVVLDPEDAPDPANLLMLLRGVQMETTSATVGWLADQIEQQTKPPKPTEPTGLGAVVEDDGRKWVHFGNGCWIMSVPNAALKTRTWDDFSSDVEVQP